jgi:hypothetical protein
MRTVAKICEVCGGKFHGTFRGVNVVMFLCTKHLHHMHRYGEIRKRTSKDSNEIIGHGEWSEVLLYDKKSHPIAKAIIDSDCLGLVRAHKWSAVKKNGKYYVKTDLVVGGKRRTMYLVTLILGKKAGHQIDHKSGDTLDNRRSNLRFATQQQNLMNKTKARGIWWNKRTKIWEAYIGVKNKKIHLGTYRVETEALNVRRAAEQKYYGDFAPKHN